MFNIWNTMNTLVFINGVDDNIIVLGADYLKTFNINSKETIIKRANRNNMLDTLGANYERIPYASKKFQDEYSFTVKENRVFGRHKDNFTFTIPYDKLEETKVRYYD